MTLQSAGHDDEANRGAAIDHPGVRAISFVGSTAAARAVSARAAAVGKRAQAQGGAKNALVIMPDAPIELVASVAVESGPGHHAVELFTQTKVVVERWP
jgi:malonate-semialdehyde dehydrogenase (acetylating) / methylmalonate-semialdehyde dehydrogenase